MKALDTPRVPATNQELGKEQFHEAADVTGSSPLSMNAGAGVTRTAAGRGLTHTALVPRRRITPSIR